MKKFIYLLVAAMLGSACADEKPHFLPLPGGSVEIGGIGATASSEASSLTDSDLTTYFSAEPATTTPSRSSFPATQGRLSPIRWFRRARSIRTSRSEPSKPSTTPHRGASPDPTTEPRGSRWIAARMRNSSPASRTTSTIWRPRPTTRSTSSSFTATAATA